MFHDLDPGSPTPLYDQIASRIRVAVAAGDLSPGDSLPSVRQLAAKLRVNPATVVQAYRQLEGDGFVEMRQGSGTFVQELPAARRSGERQQQARKLVRQLLSRGAALGLKAEELADALHYEIGGRSA